MNTSTLNMGEILKISTSDIIKIASILVAVAAIVVTLQNQVGNLKIALAAEKADRISLEKEIKENRLILEQQVRDVINEAQTEHRAIRERFANQDIAASGFRQDLKYIRESTDELKQLVTDLIKSR